jgi:CubicO group peptidase (beta-lactamase class C family)
MNQIKESPVKPQQGYVYSDLHYYTYPAFVQSITGKTWEDYLKTTYKSIGASTLTYNPRRFYGLDRIVPTEKDTLFRKTLIHGRVHDEGAGMLNGISGHAGLFGSANDLTKLMQMYLQKGSFGGKQYIKPEIIEQCTDYQFPYEGNRRGIAFEKLDFNKNISNGPQMASSKSYGHSGYTGTYTWVDPELDLVYVFLSNRVYPTRDNAKISSLNIRTEVGNQIIKTIKGK